MNDADKTALLDSLPIPSRSTLSRVTPLRSTSSGSVRCTVPPGKGMFTGVAVELDASNQIFTTLPVMPVQR